MSIRSSSGCFVLAFVLGFTLTGCGASPSDVSSDVPGPTTEELRIVVPSKSRRIAVVGAGPSGLTAADTLKQLGYGRVTVFEKNDRVGGKVNSLRVGGNVSELGAVFASPDYTKVLGLADKYNIPYVSYEGKQTILDENGNAQTADEFLKSRYSTAEILAATASYTAALGLFSAINEPTLALVPAQADLYLPFGEFAARYGFSPIAELVKSIMIGFGYGYYENTPAIYYMKLMGWLVKPSLTQGLEPAHYFTFPSGYQSIWEAVAQSLDVRLKSEVTSVARPSPTGAPVQITINGVEKLDFDEIVISAPLHRVSNFMTLGTDEADLFAQVASERYDVSLFNATGITTGEALFFHGNATPSRINHVNVWASRDPALPFVGYQIVDASATGAQITGALQDDIASRGGQLAALLLRQEWDYFPHVGTGALRGGFYYRLAALQGQRHTFYVGGTLAFETVEHSARQAEALVRTHFLPAFLP
jgi:predicted NAD/FAD-dependent oxidoreductase